MRFLTDENVATSVVLALRQAGYDVVDVKERGWFGQSDKVLTRFAAQDNRIILTHDKDFLYQQTAAVILLRFQNQSPRKVEKYLLAFLQTPLLAERLNRIAIVILSETTAELHR